MKSKFQSMKSLTAVLVGIVLLSTAGLQAAEGGDARNRRRTGKVGK